MMSPEKQRDTIGKIIARLQSGGYWGEVVLQFREGNWTMARLAQTALPEVVAAKGLSVLTIAGDPKNGS